MGAWKWWIVQINNLSRVFWVHTRVCIQEDAYWSDAQTPSTWLPSTGSSSSSSSSLWVSEQPYLSRSPTDLKGNLIPAATQSSWPSLRGGTLVWPVNRTLCLPSTQSGSTPTILLTPEDLTLHFILTPWYAWAPSFWAAAHTISPGSMEAIRRFSWQRTSPLNSS